MAATLNEVVTLTSDATFTNRVKAAIVYVAVGVIEQTDALVEGMTALDKQRRTLAIAVIDERDKYAANFSWILAVLPDITAASNDGKLVEAVNAVWNYLANTRY